MTWPDDLSRRALQVPRRHRDPGQGALQLSYGVIPAHEPSGAPPVVFLTGGPGDSAVSWWSHPPFRAAFELVAQNCDVILLDQRGCGFSEPFWRLGPLAGDFLASREEAEESLALQAQALKEASPGFQPEVLTPEESALDLAALADELGVDQVQLWGVSYGTHLAMTAMRVCPDRILRACLCGFEGPNQTWKLPATADEFLAKWGLAGQLRQALDQLEEQPFILPDGRRLSAFGLRWMMATWFGLASQAGKAKERLESLTSGGEAMAKAASGFARLMERPAAFYLKDLASGATEARLAEIRRQAPGTLLGEDLNFPFPQARQWWAQLDLGDSHRADPTFSGQVFVVTGGMDGFTPSSNVAEQGQSLPALHHQTIPTAAHDQLLLSPAHLAELAAFLGAP